MSMLIPMGMSMMQRIPRLGRARHDGLEARRERAVVAAGAVIGSLQLARADPRLVEEVGEVADAGAERVGVARDGARVVVMGGLGGLGGAFLLVARKGAGLGVAPAAG
jgi:hypothetical protein